MHACMCDAAQSITCIALALVIVCKVVVSVRLLASLKKQWNQKDRRGDAQAVTSSTALLCCVVLACTHLNQRAAFHGSCLMCSKNCSSRCGLSSEPAAVQDLQLQLWLQQAQQLPSKTQESTACFPKLWYDQQHSYNQYPALFPVQSTAYLGVQAHHLDVVGMALEHLPAGSVK